MGIFNFPLGVEACDLGRLDGGLALGIVEVGGHGDDGLADGMPQVCLGGLFQFAQDHGRDFGRRVVFAVDLDLGELFGPAHNFVGDELLFALDLFVAATHEAFDAVKSATGVGDSLAFCRVAHQAVALVGECHHAWGDAITLGIGDNLHLAAFHHGYNAVGGAQVDSNDFLFSHCSISLCSEARPSLNALSCFRLLS